VNHSKFRVDPLSALALIKPSANATFSPEKMGGEMKTIGLLGTFDSKGAEYAFVRAPYTCLWTEVPMSKKGGLTCLN
jgi:hypothetical protein